MPDQSMARSLFRSSSPVGYGLRGETQFLCGAAWLAEGENPEISAGLLDDDLGTTVCPTCGKENTQPGAAYCIYCGSSLQQQSFSPSARALPGGHDYGASMGMTSPERSERYQKALTRVEQLGYAVLFLAVIALILLFA